MRLPFRVEFRASTHKLNLVKRMLFGVCKISFKFHIHLFGKLEGDLLGKWFFFYTMRMKILAFTALFFSFCLSAQMTEKKFAPHMIDHEFEGCPENSHCSQEMGLKRLKWVQLLNQLSSNKDLDTISAIENFRQEHGLPIPMWGFPAGLKDKEIISWNSSCPHHNLELKEIFHAQMMLKSFNQIEEHDLKDDDLDKKIKVIPKTIWLEEKSGDIIDFRIPRGFLPSLIVEDQLYFTMEEEGVYYGLLVDKNGNFKVVPTQKPPAPSKEVSCSQALKKHYKNWPLEKRLYQDSYCKAIWDKENETYQVLMIGWSCP